MNKHTPGPWRADFSEAIHIRPQEGGSLAMLHHLRGPHGMAGRIPDAEVEANALLIAAAPELLAALEALLVLDTNHAHADGAGIKHWREAVSDARAAIAKATGERP